MSRSWSASAPAGTALTMSCRRPSLPMTCSGPPAGSPVEISIRVPAVGSAAASAAGSVPTGTAAARTAANARVSRPPPEPNPRELRRHFRRTIGSTDISMVLSTATNPLTRSSILSPKPSPAAKIRRKRSAGSAVKCFLIGVCVLSRGAARSVVDRSKRGCCGRFDRQGRCPGKGCGLSTAAPKRWLVAVARVPRAGGGRR